jgi:hypothetical protein
MKEKKNISKQVVWRYSSKNNTTFFSTIGSGAQRLPNGNTFICAMNDGHFFEVSPSDTSIVWEYINPVTRSGIKKIKTDSYPTDNGAFRAYRYSKDHPALKGRNLTPGKTLTGFDPDYISKSEITSVAVTKEYLKPSDLLQQNFPNPFSSQTTIGFEIADASKVNVTIFDLAGNQVKTLTNGNYPSGKYSLEWNGTNDSGQSLGSGIYFYVLKANDQMISKKMIYTR